jgi:hypothetical protein
LIIMRFGISLLNRFVSKANPLQQMGARADRLDKIYAKHVKTLDFTDPQIEKMARGIIAKSETSSRSIKEIIQRQVFELLRNMKTSISTEANIGSIKDSVQCDSAATKFVLLCAALDTAKQNFLEDCLRSAVQRLRAPKQVTA